MKKHIGTILIVLGIIIIAIPLVGRYMANQKQKELMADFLEQNVAVVEPNVVDALSQSLEWGAEVSNQETLTESVTEIDVSSEDGDSSTSTNLEDSEAIKAKPDTVALLEISKIGVKLPVAEGTDLATLKFALGHMPESASLGSVGNAVVAGHRSHSFGTYFNRLDEVEIGDTIKVTKGGVVYNYEVYETLIVEPDDLSVLRGSSNHKVITLITCTPLYTSTHRLIVHGVIKEN